MKRFLLISTSIAIIFGFGYHIALAEWEPPTKLPPEGNITAPLNVSSIGQSKQGGLIICSLGESDCKLDVNGEVVSENVVPGGDGYSLGTEDYPWEKLYLDSDNQGKIYFGPENYLIYENKYYKFVGGGDDKLTIDAVGRLKVPGGIDAGASKFNVSNDGSQVGINITSPTSGYSLHVNGKILAGGNTGETSQITGNLLVGDNIKQGYLQVNSYGYLLVGSNYKSLAKTESYGPNSLSGVYGETAHTTTDRAGVYGYAVAATGVYGEGEYGVYGKSSGTYGVYGVNNTPGFKNQKKGIAIGAKGPSQSGGDIGSDYYYSTAVSAEGGSVKNLKGNFESSAISVVGGSIGGVKKDDLVQQTYAVKGIAGGIDSNYTGELKTYGIYGEAGTVSNLGASYAGYFVGNVTVEGGDLFIDGGRLSVSGSQDHSIQSRFLTVTFAGNPILDPALDIDDGDLIIDAGKELILSDEDDVKAQYKYYGEDNCLRLEFDDEVLDQIGTGTDCDPLCERSGGHCRVTECPTGWHHEAGYFCKAPYNYCCFPGEEAYEIE